MELCDRVVKRGREKKDARLKKTLHISAPFWCLAGENRRLDDSVSEMTIRVLRCGYTFERFYLTLSIKRVFFT